MVICRSIWPKSLRWKRSVTFRASVTGWPLVSSQALPLVPAVSTTSVSPSQWPIEENLPVDGARFIEDDDQPGRLDDLPGRSHGILFGYARRQAEIIGIVLPGSIHVLLVGGRRPRL